MKVPIDVELYSDILVTGHNMWRVWVPLLFGVARSPRSGKTLIRWRSILHGPVAFLFSTPSTIVRRWVVSRGADKGDENSSGMEYNTRL